VKEVTSKVFLMSPATAPHSDVVLLFVTRAARMFAYGTLSPILGLYLLKVGLSEAEIGLLLAMTLAGDTVISLWLTTRADRLGRKRMLIAGALLMVLGGVVFAGTGYFWPLLLAATIGVISPHGKEVGPFLPIEQAALSQSLAAGERTRTFAWYHLAGSLAAALGALACGLFVATLQAGEVSDLPSYRTILWIYAVVGLLLAVLFLRLSPAAEAPWRASGLNPGAPRFGLHRSRGIVLKLSGLFALDAFGGGFILDSLVALWLHERFSADVATLGAILSAANLLAGLSGPAAAALARRFGLLNTMVFTHVPSNLLLLLVPLMPTLPLAVTILLLRFAISQMDVPTRQSYTVAVVDPDERSAAAGVTGVARSTGAALSPPLSGIMLTSPLLAFGLPFLAAGVLKLIYDGLLFLLFRRIRLPEEGERN
jgi:MFS family permease